MKKREPESRPGSGGAMPLQGTLTPRGLRATPAAHAAHIARARRRLRQGFYDSPRIIDHLVRRLRASGDLWRSPC